MEPAGDLFDWAARHRPPPGEFSPSHDGLLLGSLAKQGVYLGCSSWKYPGWIGRLYTRQNYTAHGRFSQARFERECLAEYARVLPAVCVDATFYAFPKPSFLSFLAAATPETFRFAFKTPSAITMRAFPDLPRFGASAGAANPEFLNPALFEEQFLGPLRSLGPRLGVVILEFTRFSPGVFTSPEHFAAALARFLDHLHDPPPLAVEIRNPELLTPSFLETLDRHNAGYVFNQWTGMPPVDAQLAAVTSPPGGFITARFLLAGGRFYKDAVAAFSPYNRVQSPHEPSRAAARSLINTARRLPRPSFLFFNNRLEGNALDTIAAVIRGLGPSGPQ